MSPETLPLPAAMWALHVRLERMKLQSWWQRRRVWREPDRWWSSSSCRHLAGPLHSTKHPIHGIQDTLFKVREAPVGHQRHTETVVCVGKVLQQLSANQRDVNKVQAILLHLVRKSVSGWKARHLGCRLARTDVCHVKAAPTIENACYYWSCCLLIFQEGAGLRWNLSKLQNMRKLQSAAWHAGDSWTLTCRPFIKCSPH